MLLRFFSLLILFSLPVFALAQSTPPKDAFEISDIPEEEPRPYFAVGGGFNYQMLQPNFDAINSMTQSLGIPALAKSMTITGGLGFISAPFAKNMRIGGGGYGGAVTACNDVVDTVNGSPVAERRTISYAIGCGGLTIEYVVPFGFTRNKVILVGGAFLGMGSITVQLDQTTSDPRTWNGFFTGGTSANFSRNIHAAFFAAQPYINLEYSIFPFLMLRVGAGYNLTAMGTFTADRTIDISGVPNISGNGLSYGAGIFLGIFR